MEINELFLGFRQHFSKPFMIFLWSTRRTKAWIVVQFGGFIADYTNEVKGAMDQCYMERKVFKGELQGSVFDLAPEKYASWICKVYKTQDSERSLKIAQIDRNQQDEIECKQLKLKTCIQAHKCHGKVHKQA